MRNYLQTGAIGIVTGAVLGWFYGCFTQIWNYHTVGHVGFDSNHLMTIWVPGHVPAGLVLPKVALLAVIGCVGLMLVRYWVTARGVRSEANINELLATAFGIECLFVGGLTMLQDLLVAFGIVAMLVSAFVGVFVFPAAIDHTRFQEQIFAYDPAPAQSAEQADTDTD